MEKLLPESKSIRQKPFNFNSKDEAQFAHELERNINATFLENVSDAIVTIDGIVAKKLKVFPNSLLNETHNKIFDWKYLLCTYIMKTKRSLNGTYIAPFNLWSNGYFHWITEVIPRLFILKKYLAESSIILPKISNGIWNKESLLRSLFNRNAHELNYRNPSFYLDSLQPFEIYKLEFLESNEYLKVEKLMLPSSLAPSGNYNDELIRDVSLFYTNYFKPTIKIKSLGNKFYISREKARKRKVLNEGKLQEVLNKYDITTIYYEDFNFADQVRIAQQAKLIISIHGANLTNTMFMKKKSFILEFRRNEDHHFNCYFSLASAVNVHYLYQNCEFDGNLDLSVYNNNLKVDIELFEKNLNLIFKSEEFVDL